MKKTIHFIRLSILLCLVVVFSYVTSDTFAYWANSITGEYDDSTGLIYIGEWGITVNPPSGIPDRKSVV